MKRDCCFNPLIVLIVNAKEQMKDCRNKGKGCNVSNYVSLYALQK